MLGRVQCTKFDCFGHVGTFHFLFGGWGDFFSKEAKGADRKITLRISYVPHQVVCMTQDMPLPNHWLLSHFFMTSGLWKSWVVSINNIWSFNIPPSPGGAQPPRYLIFLDRPAQIPITLTQLNVGKKLATQNSNANKIALKITVASLILCTNTLIL